MKKKLSLKKLYENDFSLLCWDFVSNPSTHGAFMKPMNESKKIEMQHTSYRHQLVTDIICELSGVCCLKNN